jgi:hypothetical protein
MTMELKVALRKSATQGNPLAAEENHMPEANSLPFRK